MGLSRFYSAVNFLFFCLVFQRYALHIKADAQCLNPKFDKTKKITVEYFFASKASSHNDELLCQIIKKSNGLISIIYRMAADTPDTATCMKNLDCIVNRKFACYYKYAKDAYNDCNAQLPPLGTQIADCVCAGEANDILTTNQTAYKNYGIDGRIPALVVDQKFDPCFKDYSLKGMTDYFCKAYNNELPVCHK